MKTRIVLALALAAFLLIGTGGFAQSRPQYSVERGTVAGGGYQLAVLSWQVDGAASGGSYRLSDAGALAPLAGSGCCCTYLPCVLRNY